MTALRQLRPSGLLRRLVPLALLGAVLAAPASAQRSGSSKVLITEDGTAPRELKPRNKFSLFALGDLGVAGMRMTGQFGWHVTSYGPCSDGFIVGECGDVLKPEGFYFNVFEISLTAATPPSDFAKIRNVYPGAAAAEGNGWNAQRNELLFGGAAVIGPADGSAGRLFSGVASTNDGSCRDFTSALNGYVGTGFSLLAVSDCPETWAGTFDGPRVYADTTFRELLTASADENTFRFDDWRIPASAAAATELAGNFSTYGTMSDYFRDVLELYGGITKKGTEMGFTGDPQISGYPLGIDYRFDAFQYALPSINNVVYYRLLVVNNSAQVYGGTGVDYDSLYMGLSPGWGRAQQNSVYYIPSKNMLLSAETGTSGSSTCNGASVTTGTFPCATTGFSRGATGIAVLKSPIGDNRNKLFTTPGQMFYNPANEHAGDTITFNHGHMCGYGGCYANSWVVNERRSFGMVSSTGDNILDGRAASSLGASEYFRTFRSVDYPTRTARFNRYIPGNWDYNHDGRADTLFYDSCHTQGCVATWADTMPGPTKYVNRYSNVGGVMTAGPFKLKAGDTTEFIFAFFGAPDRGSIETVADNAVNAYQTFFLVPKPAPAPRVAFTATTPAEIADPVVRIGYTTEATTYTDQYLANYATLLATSDASSYRVLRTLNPWLADSVEARAQANLSDILIFKSCDGGSTFTADNDCDGDPLVNAQGATVGTGWRPYAIIPRDSVKDAVFTDANVIGGKTYLYSFVTRTVGFRAMVIDSVNGRQVARELVVVDTTYSPLQRNGPTVAKVYVPISLAAGAERASATVTNAANVYGDIPITFRFADQVPAGNYTLVFGNEFTVRDAYNTATRQHSVRTVVRTVVPARTSAGTNTTIVRDSQVFVSNTVPSISATAMTTADSVAGDSTIHVTTITGTGAALVDASSKVFFVSTTLTGLAATPADFSSRSDFPGFTINLDQSTGTQLTFERIIEPDNDTLPLAAQNLATAALNLVETRTQKRTDVSGQYTFTFAEDAFGPGAPFRNQGAAQTEAAVLASLNARPTASTASVAPEVKAALAGVVDTSRLFAARLPFTLTNNTYAGRQLQIAVPRRAPANNTIRLGSGADTLSIVVPDSIWLPGDSIYVVETFERDSLVGSRVQLDGAGNPIRISTPRLTLGPVVLDCTNATTLRLQCNPLAQGELGASPGYYDYAPNTKLVIRYQTPFAAGNTVNLAVTPLTVRPQTVTAAQLKQVRVIPNPFVVQSQYNTVANNRVGDARVIFSGMPASGSVRIYSLSGQFLQEITWTEADLNGTGDLPYDLRTREGTDLASGLYVFVVKGRGTDGKQAMARGKFVVIR